LVLMEFYYKGEYYESTEEFKVDTVWTDEKLAMWKEHKLNLGRANSTAAYYRNKVKKGRVKA